MKVDKVIAIAMSTGYMALSPTGETLIEVNHYSVCKGILEGEMMIFFRPLAKKE